MVCVFFGHRECYGLEPEVLQSAVEDMIAAGADTFYVGHQGQFDRMVLTCLRKLSTKYPHISFAVVLATPEAGDSYRDCSISPRGWSSLPPDLPWTGETAGCWIVRTAAYVM